MDLAALIEQMTLEEKASLCSGADFWHLQSIQRLGIPSVMVADGPHGLRKQARGSDHMGMNISNPATCFPTASALASTWNRELVYQVGQALGEECRQEQVIVILGPGANIKRSPVCGRNFEYFSEDPYLTGQIAKSHIQGVQSQGIGTSLKHFAANNQETRRMTIDAVIDERALREIYLSGFETAVKDARPWTVMCAYNKLNGTYCSENHTLLTSILREEWGFEGIVVTDWGAVNDRVKGLIAGTELEMPGSRGFNDAKIVAAVKSGALDETILDQSVERLLALIFRGSETLSQPFSFDRGAHHQLARQAAVEGMVLLKNEAGILPLNPNDNLAVIGAFAKFPKFQAYGSSMINPFQVENALDEMERTAVGTVTYAAGYDTDTDDVDQDLIEEACSAAKIADTVILFAGLTDIYESEGLDREHMRLPTNHTKLIEAVARVNPRLVVVLYNGAPVEMPWIGQAKAVLEGYLAGQAAGSATADILFGKQNPSGKLAETFPLKFEDNPSYAYFPQGPVSVEYRESIFVGYRYYDTAKKDVLFPFGHGLSYTSFAYTDLKLGKHQIAAGEEVSLSLTVKNTGALAGKEIVQLYIHDEESSIFKAEKELKGFEKVFLLPGETKEVVFHLGKRDFAFYNTGIHDWTVEAGVYQILIGSSSRDIRLSASVTISTVDENISLDPAGQPAPANIPTGLIFSGADFRALYGKELPGNKPDTRRLVNMNTPVGDLPNKFFGKLIYQWIIREMDNLLPEIKDKKDPLRFQRMLMRKTVIDLPLRSFATMDDNTDPIIVEGMIHFSNGQIFKAVLKLIQGLVSMQKRNGK